MEPLYAANENVYWQPIERNSMVVPQLVKARSTWESRLTISYLYKGNKISVLRDIQTPVFTVIVHSRQYKQSA